MGQNEINEVSKMLNVKSMEIQNMESRLTGGDFFLNQTLGDEEGNDFLSMLEDDSDNPEKLTESYYDNKSKMSWLKSALETLTDREKTIIKSRKLKDKSISFKGAFFSKYQFFHPIKNLE